MFGELLKRLAAPAPAALPDTDARLALTALMVRIARTDGHYDADEAAQIQTVIRERYGLDEAQTQQLKADAEAFEAQAPDTVRFTRAIKDATPLDDRIAVMEALWSIALADGHRDQHEDTQLRLVANLLGVNDKTSALARQKAAKNT